MVFMYPSQDIHTPILLILRQTLAHRCSATIKCKFYTIQIVTGSLPFLYNVHVHVHVVVASDQSSTVYMYMYIMCTCTCTLCVHVHIHCTYMYTCRPVTLGNVVNTDYGFIEDVPRFKSLYNSALK